MASVGRNMYFLSFSDKMSIRYTGLFKMIVGVLATCHTQYTWDSSIYIYFYLIEQNSKFLLHTLQVLDMCAVCDSTGLFEMIVRVLTTCHTQYTWDWSIYIFLFNRTTLQLFVTYLTGALYVHPLWFYKHQHDNRVHSKLFVACQQWWGYVKDQVYVPPLPASISELNDTNQNRHWNHHGWHATVSLERTHLSYWCL